MSKSIGKDAAASEVDHGVVYLYVIKSSVLVNCAAVVTLFNTEHHDGD